MLRLFLQRRLFATTRRIDGSAQRALRDLRDESNTLQVAEDSGPLCTVAIVGQPNVGKSTLFNRLTSGKRKALVSPIAGGDVAVVYCGFCFVVSRSFVFVRMKRAACSLAIRKKFFHRRIENNQHANAHSTGTTRDIATGRSAWDGCEFSLLDTGGIVYGDRERLQADVSRLARAATDEADVILFLVDGQQEPNDNDRKIARALRQANKVSADEKAIRNLCCVCVHVCVVIKSKRMFSIAAGRVARQQG